MKSLSLNFRQAAYASRTARYPIHLVTITHPDLTDDIRLSTDPTQRLDEYTTVGDVVYGTVSRGQNYIFFPIRLKLPNDTKDGPGDITLEIDNVHRTYTEIIRSIFSPPVVRTEIVMDNTLDVVERSWPHFLLTNITYDATVISATLKMETLLTEPFPAGIYSPAYFRGLF